MSSLLNPVSGRWFVLFIGHFPYEHFRLVKQVLNQRSFLVILKEKRKLSNSFSYPKGLRFRTSRWEEVLGSVEVQVCKS